MKFFSFVIHVEEALNRAAAYEKAGADAILIHSNKKTSNEIFQFCDSWNGNVPLVAIPTSYGHVTTKEFIDHRIKMIIYANQTLRVSHIYISKLLEELKNSDNLSQISYEMSSMEDIFKMQQMYGLKKEEQEIQEQLRKMGYID